MMLRLKILPFLLFLAAVLTLSGHAQDIIGDAEDKPAEPEKEITEPVEKKKISYRLLRGKKEIEIVSGFAPTQPTFFSGNKEYDTDGRKFGMFNVRWTRTFGTRKGVTYQYFFEATPLAIAVNNEADNPKYISATETPKEPKKIKKTAYGAGFQPINFRFIFKPSSRIKPFVHVGAGMIFFNQRMPVTDSTHYNFTGDFGGGIYYTLDRERQQKALVLGYRYFHISNFNTSKSNPGYNANIFYLGYSFSRR
jgi:hypothetical protein